MQSKSLFNQLNSDFNVSTINTLDVTGSIDLNHTTITGLGTDQVTEQSNLYYTEARVDVNTNVSANTTHRNTTSGNPHNVLASDVGITNLGSTNIITTAERNQINTNQINITNIENKTDFISVSQNVDLDTMESDITANNAKNSYPSADATKVGYISVTQAVDLDTMETNVTTNNSKISYTDAAQVSTNTSNIAAINSYPSADATKVGYISVTQAVDLDSMESNINNKVSLTGAETIAGNKSFSDQIFLDDGSQFNLALGFTSTANVGLYMTGGSLKLFHTNDNISISNGATYLHTDLLSTSGDDIGSSSQKFADLYLSGDMNSSNVNTDTLNVTGQSITQDLRPDGNNTRLLGNDSNRWSFLYGVDVDCLRITSDSIRINESGTGGNYTTIQGASSITDYTLTLPDAIHSQSVPQSMFFNSSGVGQWGPSESSWTATFGDGTNTFNILENRCKYYVMGTFVHVVGHIRWGSKGSASGDMRLSLPSGLELDSTIDNQFLVIGYYNGITGLNARANIFLIGTNNGTYMNLAYMDSGSGNNPVNLTDSNFQTNSTLAFQGVYITNT